MADKLAQQQMSVQVVEKARETAEARLAKKRGELQKAHAANKDLSGKFKSSVTAIQAAC